MSINKLKEKCYSFFVFSKKEVKGLTVLLIILLSLITFFFIQKKLTKKAKYPTKEDQIYLDSLAKVVLNKSLGDSLYQINPNELSYFQWMDFGISSELANAILRKKRKQKQFNCLDEIKAIQGVDSSSLVQYFKSFSLEEHCPVVSKEKLSFSINQVTKKELSTIDGIPYNIASRIVNYRQKLGGYYSVLQLREVHKLTNVEYIKLKAVLKIDASKIKKIKINTANYVELKSHPYLTPKQATTIVRFRKKIIRYDGVSQFSKVYGLTDKDVEKIKPYLFFD